MTATGFDMLLIGGRVATPGGITRTDIGIREGRIAAIGDLARHDAGERIDVTGLHVLPGVIDTQVHFREPGNEHKEDLETGSRAAVLGGVVAVFEMPNTSPPTTTAEAVTDKLARARGRMWCDHAFYVGATAENVADLPALERMAGVAGIKVFMGSSTGSLLVPDDATLARVLAAARRRVAIHAEDEARLIARKELVRPGDPASHPLWRDAQTALRATKRIVALAERLRRRIHVLHVTTAEEMAFLARHREWASVEVTPQHLTLAAPGCYRRLGTLAQMNPPIRDRRHRTALWRALREGVVDVIGSDHAPHTREEKARPYPQSPSGMPGVQTLLPLLLDHHAHGRLSLQRLVDLTSAGAARLFGLLGKGRIAVGFDADFSIVDLKARWTVTEGWLASRAGWSPFAGMTITGRPLGTIIRGHRVMWEGELIEGPIGRPLRFAEAV